MFLAAMAAIFAGGAIAPLAANGQDAAGTCGVARTVVSREAVSTDTSYPGARPFNGPRVLVFEVRPAVSGTARLTLSSGSAGNASLGHMDTFEGAVSNGIARFSLNLPYDRQYEFMKLAAGDSRPVSVVRAEGEFIQTEAEAMRLDVETGNPLHLVRDDTERPVLAVRNPTERVIAWQAVFELTDVFGRRLDIPFSRMVAAKTDVRVEIPWPLPAKGLWRVAAKVKGADGSTARKETRFAFVDRHERTPIAEKPKFRFGIHYHGTRYWPHLLDNTISALVASGAKLTRCDYDHMWGDIERAKGKFDWKKSDAMIERLRNAGLALDIIMFSEPPWAMDEGAKAKVADQKKRGHRVRYIPLKPGTLRTFAETYARRYGTKIDYYEVGNEMDLTSCESFPHEAALAIQREAYEGIHAGCSNACVTTCGWAYAFTEPNATPDRWNVGLPEAFAEHPETYDAWALHVHGSFAKYADIIDGGYAALRQRTPLKTRPWIANETALTCVKGQEETVARNVWMKPLFAWSRGARDYVWYNLRATGWFDGHEPGYGLITPDFYPRAGYAAFAALTAVFQGLDYDGAVYSHRLRHLLCFKGMSQAFPTGGLVLAGWDDGLGVNGMRTVRLATDAKSAEICDHMGNRTPVAVKGGEVAFPLRRDPQALLLFGATKAVAADMKELTRSREGAKIVNLADAARSADFIVGDSAHFKSLYEANPPFVHRLWKGPKDLSAKLWFGRTDEGLLRVKCDVTDDIAAEGDALEMTVVTSDQGRCTFKFKPSGRTGTVTRYDVTLPVKENSFALDFRVLEDDGEGADGWLMLCREGEDPVECKMIFGKEKKGITRWHAKQGSAEPDIARMFASSEMHQERIAKRMEIAKRLTGHVFADNVMRDEDIQGFRLYLEEELARWKEYPGNPAVEPTVLNVAEFGALGDGVATNDAAFARAVAAVRSRGGKPTLLKIPAGEYYFAGRKNGVAHVNLAALTNCVVAGEGPERTRFLFGEPDCIGVNFDGCCNSTLAAVEMYWKTCPFSQGMVEKVEKSAEPRALVIRHVDGTKRPDDPHYRQTKRAQVCGTFDEKGHQVMGAPLFFDTTAPVEDLGAGRFRIRLDPKHKFSYDQMNVKTGMTVVLPDRVSNITAVRSHRSRFCNVDSVWIRNSPEAAFTTGGEYVTAWKCRVFPLEPHFRLSTNADAFYNAPGTFLGKCEFRNMNDDGGNCHYRGASLISADANTRKLRFAQRGISTFRPGEPIQIYRAKTGELLATLHVERSVVGTDASGRYCEVAVREQLPKGLLTRESLKLGELTADQRYALSHGVGEKPKEFADIVYAPHGCGLGYVVTGCTFADFRGIAINTQCPNTLIENNVIEYCNHGVQVSSLMMWYEGLPCYNLVVRGNSFRHTRHGVNGYLSTVDNGSCNVDYIRGVLVESNSYESVRFPVRFRNCRDVTVKDDVSPDVACNARPLERVAP